MKDLYLGVDFGTTYTCVAYFENSLKILLNENGNYTTPSAIFFEKSSPTILFGSSAFSKNEGSLISNWKRILGKTFDQLTTEDVNYFKSKQVNIVDINNTPHFEIEYNNNLVYYNTLDITIFYLKYIHSLITQTIGCYNLNAIITIPVHFSTNSRTELSLAFTKSGFNVLKILNEPTAASLAYKSLEYSQNILVFDCGGGTTDLSLIKTDIGLNIFEVLHVVGDNFLGGEDLTRNLVNYIVHKYNIKNTWKNYKKLFIQSEICKAYLSNKKNTEYTFCIECIVDNNDNIFDLSLKVSQNLFIDINRDFFEKIKKLASNFIDFFIYSHIEQVIFIGGSSKFFYFKNIFQKLFPNITITTDNICPDQAVAIGACNYSSHFEEKKDDENDILLLDIVPMSLGVETTGGLFETIIPRSTTLPVSRIKTFTNDSDDLNIEIKIYQGESRFVNNNYHLNTLVIPLDKQYSKAEAKISIEFEIDTSGILNITVDINEKQIKTQLTKQYITNRLPENLDDIVYKYTIDKLYENILANKILEINLNK